ncbi:MAG: hypothetical protein U0941_20410 [Planctomycetaceae bacterium]
MHYLLNDLSIHGQFNSAADFIKSIDVLMSIRQVIRQTGRELYCHRDLGSVKVTAGMRMPQAIQEMPLEKRRPWMQWVTQFGPYWSEDREHSEDDYLELEDGEIVTNFACGEAAFCISNGLGRELISISPSEWLKTPVVVRLVKKSDSLTIEVVNHWTSATVATSLAKLPAAFDSWKSLEECVHRTCPLLTFSQAAFESLKGHPYIHGAAERILIRLQVLNKMRTCFDEEGNRTTEGHRIYTDHFTGEKAWFSDSSDSEKRDFESDLTFQNPSNPAQYLFCTWHGKVKTPQLRIHFSWPIAKDTPLYVVYVGPKITKR